MAPRTIAENTREGEFGLTLDVAIATHRPEGIRRVAKMKLPVIPGVSYVVSWQDHQESDVPPELKRDDVRIFRYGVSGQSNNRNNALAHCTADIVLNSDDDVVFFPEGLEKIIGVFEANPGLAVASFRSEHGDMSRFPKGTVRLGRKYPKGYHVSGIEIAFRRSSQGSLRFCPELGFASESLHGGEDEMFMYTAVMRGLECRYFPVTICSHPHESTGFKHEMTPGNLKAQGCVIALMNPWTCVLRIPLKAWRLKRCGQSGIMRAMLFLAAGASMARGVLRRNHDSMW